MPCRDLMKFENLKEIFTPYLAVSVKEECLSNRYWLTDRNYVDSKNIRFNLLTKKGETILGNICCADKDFFAYQGKKYAWINNIRLKPELKMKQTVKKFSKKWDKKYIENEISAIALEAIDDGIIAWHRLGFEYQNATDKVILKALFADYVNETKGLELDIIDLQKVDSSYFFDEKLGSFTQWLNSKDSTRKMPMIRRLK